MILQGMIYIGVNNPKYYGLRTKNFFAVSIVVFLAGIVTMILVNRVRERGIFNFGIEFTGDASYECRSRKKIFK